MSTDVSGGAPVRIFYAYARRDEQLRERLEEQLAALRQQGIIEEWHDRQIVPGSEWDQAIGDQLEAADIILLLVSSSFIASDYCRNRETQRALERHRAEEARVIPVILRSCDWKHTPLKDLQALPRDGKPVVEWRPQDRGWLSVAQGIRRAVLERRSSRSSSTAESRQDRTRSGDADRKGAGTATTPRVREAYESILHLARRCIHEVTQVTSYGRDQDDADPIAIPTELRNNTLWYVGERLGEAHQARVILDLEPGAGDFIAEYDRFVEDARAVRDDTEPSQPWRVIRRRSWELESRYAKMTEIARRDLQRQ